ncbi:MAG: prepilin-type N-terminal cleavage/methylation domain-containing protein [Magnetococcus sp. DMHC-8]
MMRTDSPAGRTDRQAGFTLLELAIVLLVIGLLLGGVLQGRQVVEAARSKRLALETAIVGDALRTYRSLYAAWPGDDPRAGERWPGAVAGNGNGMIDGHWWPERANEESSLVWSHLRHARLIAGEGSDTTPPRHPLGGRIGVGQRPLGLPGPAICLEEIPTQLAAGYDRQFDDGSWNTGRIRRSAPPLTGSGAEAGDPEMPVWICTQW